MTYHGQNVGDVVLSRGVQAGAGFTHEERKALREDVQRGVHGMVGVLRYHDEDGALQADERTGS